MIINVANHPPALDKLMCLDRAPDGKGSCTRPQFHSGLHVAHGDGRNGYYDILAVWDGNRTDDEVPS